MAWFDGFETRRVDTGETDINLRIGGGGSPVVLLHGYPQTHVIWRHLAPRLADNHTVVCPDLRGYGDSGIPASDSDHVAYSKRAMAGDIVHVMASLGFDQFAVVGHDRGARVAYRLCLDHPDVATRMCSLDVIPTKDMWEMTDKGRALGGFHWSFLAQPEPRPEVLIGHDPDHWLDWLLESWAADASVFNDGARDEYKRHHRRPEIIHAHCEDYRAGATIDHALDAEDYDAGRRIQCPIMCLWGQKRDIGGPRDGDNLNVWRQWAADPSTVSGGPLRSGHFLPEEVPDQVVEHLRAFLAGDVASADSE